MDILFNFILNTFSNKTYTFCQVNIPKLYKRNTTRSHGLNRFDDTMTDLQNIHTGYPTLRPVYILIYLSVCHVTCIYTSFFLSKLQQWFTLILLEPCSYNADSCSSFFSMHAFQFLKVYPCTSTLKKNSLKFFMFRFNC